MQIQKASTIIFSPTISVNVQYISFFPLLLHMDEVEGNKRIAFWETKLVAYRRKNNASGIKRAEDTIKRIKAAMGNRLKPETKRSASLGESEDRKNVKSGDKGKGEDKGGMI